MERDVRALRVGPRLSRLTGAYPPADQVFAAAGVGQRERAVLARLWISEGIPYAFRQCPGLYEEVRNWLAAGLELDAKCISVAGSGRLGYSLASKRWGDRYRPDSSDLDFFAVSASLFERLRGDFERWNIDYTEGDLQPPRGDRKSWDDNRRETPGSIGRGFIDSWRVPNREVYRQFLGMNRRLEGLFDRLRSADAAPKPPKVPDLRCYRDWGSYERQVSLSLKFAVDGGSSPVPR